MTQKDIILEACGKIVAGKWPQPEPFQVELSVMKNEYDVRLLDIEKSIAVTYIEFDLPIFMRVLGLPEPLEWVTNRYNVRESFYNESIRFICCMEDDRYELKMVAKGPLVLKRGYFPTPESAQEAAYWWLVELRNPKKP